MMKDLLMRQRRALRLLPFLILSAVLLLPQLSRGADAVRVAVIPWKVNSVEKVEFLKDALPEMISSRIGAGQAVAVISQEDVRKASPDAGAEFTDAVAARVAKALKADYVVYGSITVLGTSVSLDARAFNAKDGSVRPFGATGSGMDSIVGLVDRVSAGILANISGVPVAAPQAQVQQPVVTQEKPAPRDTAESGFIIKPAQGPSKALWRSSPIDGMVLAVASADLDRDGARELFLIKNDKLIIARIAAEKLEVIKEINAEAGVQNIAVTAIDSDGDGAPEIYVSGVRNNRPYTSIVEYKDNEYRITATSANWAVRSVQVRSGEYALIGQGFGKGGFSGPIHLLKKEGAALVDKGVFEITLPRKYDLYRFEPFDFAGGKEARSIAVLDERDYLRLYRKGKDGKWAEYQRSRDYYGGSLDLVELGEADRPVANEPVFATVEGRFYAKDLVEAGKTEIVIKRNVPGGLGRYAATPRSYTSGAVVSLTVQRDHDPLAGPFAENWRTKEVDGYIADFFIEEAKDGKGMTMVIVENTTGFTGEIKSYILLSHLSL